MEDIVVLLGVLVAQAVREALLEVQEAMMLDNLAGMAHMGTASLRKRNRRKKMSMARNRRSSSSSSRMLAQRGMR
jgi:CO/xanthine dehydrogenase Mo-binding subunit